ncbi:MAG: hypothetical protein WCG01_02370 [bacterium]|nr:hypothetical protein [Candidatus Falkowbacteria bacterium]
MPFEIHLENLNEIREVFRQFPSIADQEIQDGLERAGKLITRIEKEEVPIGVSGQLRQSIMMRLVPNNVTIAPDKNYAIDVHEGTPPHYVSVKNPRDPLRIWAIKKGINPYAVQRSIAKKGTKPNPFVERTVASAEGEVRQIFSQVLENIIKRI